MFRSAREFQRLLVVHPGKAVLCSIPRLVAQPFPLLKTGNGSTRTPQPRARLMGRKFDHDFDHQSIDQTKLASD